MEDENSYLRELLEERGWYKKWYTSIMADILYPHVQKLAQPEQNCALARFKEEENNLLALYMAKEFMKNVGLRSTLKIFEAEAGLGDVDQEFQRLIESSFNFLKHSTPDRVEPPLLSQALHVWKMAEDLLKAEQPDDSVPLLADQSGSCYEDTHYPTMDFSNDTTYNPPTRPIGNCKRCSN